ncbi:hypothetical protein CEXT_636991 [Caerostris extrusa]|uniref:Uncharacterized protein n=1 Tax=Caerostris extrusa TaxID=172846 RepID=A0AAV4TEL5_CAEEX|nr:hypothetical protein CEXT_636991 [Caerostris extrusa]
MLPKFSLPLRLSHPDQHCASCFPCAGCLPKEKPHLQSSPEGDRDSLTIAILLGKTLVRIQLGRFPLTFTNNHLQAL